MKLINTLTILFTLTLLSCNRLQVNQADSDIFSSRIHTTDLETDWYRPLGQTTLKKHLKFFNEIDWKAEYWKEDISGTFNYTDLEVLNESKSKYLSVSVCPYTYESFQFLIGFGTHKKNPDNGKIIRSVRLYGTTTDNPDKTIELIKLFYGNNHKEIEKQLSKLDFFQEIEDVYQNIEIK